MPGHLIKIMAFVSLVLLALVTSPDAGTAPEGSLDAGLIRVRSEHPVAVTAARLRTALESRGITLFAQIEQSQLAAAEGIALRPSVLLIFGNAAIGGRFITAEPLAGLDWPVRLLVSEDQAGQVWIVYEDFAQMARRHRIPAEDMAVRTAARVVAALTADVAQRE